MLQLNVSPFIASQFIGKIQVLHISTKYIDGQIARQDAIFFK